MLRRARRPRPAVAWTAALLVVTAACGPSGPRVALVGDSITDGARNELDAALGDAYELEIVGRFGKRTEEVEPEVAALATSTPSAVVINLGTNDVLQRVPTERAAASLDRMVAALGEADCVLVVTINESMTVSGTSFTDGARALNARIEQIADAHDNASVVDWNAAIDDHGGNDELTSDTFHPSAAGRAVLADAYRDAVDRC